MFFFSCDVHYLLDWNLDYFLYHAWSFNNLFHWRHFHWHFNSDLNYFLYYLRNLDYLLNYPWHNHHFLNYFLYGDCFGHLNYLLDDFLLDFGFGSDSLLDDGHGNGVLFLTVDRNLFPNVVRDSNRYLNWFFNGHDEGFHDLYGHVGFFLDIGDDRHGGNLLDNVDMLNKEGLIDEPVDDLFDFNSFRNYFLFPDDFGRLWHRHKDFFLHGGKLDRPVNYFFNGDNLFNQSVNGNNLFFGLDGFN